MEWIPPEKVLASQEHQWCDGTRMSHPTWLRASLTHNDPNRGSQCRHTEHSLCSRQPVQKRDLHPASNNES